MPCGPLNPDRDANLHRGGMAFVFADNDERPDQLWMAPDRYTREQIGDAVLYLPIDLPSDGDG